MNQDIPPSSISTTIFSQQITEKLNDKKFLLWQQQIEQAIIALGLNSFIASPQILVWYLSNVDRDLDCVNPQFSMWQKQDKFFLVWLQSILSSSRLARVLGSSHSYQVWDKIHTYFHHQTRTKARQLQSELHHTYLNSRPISEFLVKIKTIYWWSHFSRRCCNLSRAHGFNPWRSS